MCVVSQCYVYSSLHSHTHIYIVMIGIFFFTIYIHSFIQVYDVGCGDGRVLIQMASRSIPFISNEDEEEEDDDCSMDDGDEETNNATITTSSSSTLKSSFFTNNNNHHHHHYCKQFIGIEISQERADEAQSNIQHAQTTNQIPSHVSIEIICANALDTDVIDYSRATVIFLYLVPRGLRLIKPIVWPKKEEEGVKKSTRIITYMSPFEDEEFVRRELCHVDHQVGAAWPVYLYHTSWTVRDD